MNSKIIYLKSGEAIDFNKIIDTMENSLCYVSYDLIHDYERAKDITYDCLAKFLTKPERFNDYKDIKYFLRRMVENASVDYLRRKNRWIKYVNVIRNQPDPLEKNILESKYNTPDLLEEVYDKIKLLPEKERLVFTLIYLEGYTLEEVSQQLGTALTTVKNQLSNATAKLRKALGANGYILLMLLIHHAISKN